MTDKTHARLLAAGSLLVLTATAPAFAAPAEPLVVSQLSDPDPNYVPPKPEPRKKGRRANQQADDGSSLDQAMQNLGMVIGQAAQIERRREGATPEQLEAEKHEVMKRIQERMGDARPN
jgi:hypothetical protein